MKNFTSLVCCECHRGSAGVQTMRQFYASSNFAEAPSVLVN